MTDEMNIADYLSQGGKLTNPANVPPRYRAELMKLMSIFVDSELAGAAGFADVINAGPGIKERIAAARIVLEKTDHADKVLRLMGEFGANTDRYVGHHPWTDRLPRDTAPGSARSTHDMRLSVFNYPLDGWVDAVVMNLCMGHAVAAQLDDMMRSSYQPLAEAIRDVTPRETRHTELAEEGLARLAEQGQGAAIADSLAYWRPRVAAIFGDPSADRLAQLKGWGLRHATASEMRDAWETRLDAALNRLGLTQAA
ncbi:Phenylacetic acid catabolic protein [Antarctobacter heliothermus]|uniref:1,2-phenylacetyl-CoA epoxidase, catalytic subunit n=1 Tax=Antarctobacter heliothermus TaxID=74033 RepID=A0A239JGR6_9RHOB|nr:Phenylacetic acid catabolic protein [Antarctobacter heliothermus]SNT05091.1 1,2-phenylacetyl-CoA epoxidase, catalytic subunit [Antarctobacter heliothermus]